MPKEIKLWHIREDDKLEAWQPERLNLGARLEKWIEQDVSILSPDLLVIGRQVETAFGGVIDLLCLNSQGDTVIVELKRDLTPREVTAQALDYASWVHGLSNDAISDIAGGYLGPRVSLDEAFSDRFGEDLPDVLNENQSILIVGSQIDAATERIINYLSDAYGANVNAVTFQYLQDGQGHEVLARVFLVEPSRVEYQARTKGRSKRRRALTYEELQSVAEAQGVEVLYTQAVSAMGQMFQRDRRVTSIAFKADFNGSKRVFFSLIPGQSSREEGLHFQIYALRICKLLGMEETDLLALLPARREPWTYYGAAGPDYSGYSGFFQTAEDVERFVNGVALKARG